MDFIRDTLLVALAVFAIGFFCWFYQTESFMGMDSAFSTAISSVK